MITLGDKVRDRVSGFIGIAVARYQYLNGCERIEVQPPVNDKGEHVEARVFDHQQLEVVEARALQLEERTAPATGGPQSSRAVAR